MLAWLGGKRKLLEAAKAKGANSSAPAGARQAPKQSLDGRSSTTERKQQTLKRAYQHSTQQHVQHGPYSQPQAATTKRLRVANSSQSMDVLMCNGVHLEEPHTVSAQPGAADGHLKHDQAEPTCMDGHAATAAVAGAGPHTSSIANHSSNSGHASSINAARVHAAGWKHAVPAATQQQPTAVSLLAGSISPQAAEPVPPAALPIAPTASTFGQTGLTRSSNSTTTAGTVASAGRCAD